MVIAQQQPEKLTWRARFWRGMVSHKPLKKHIDWWLRGMAILAVPLIIGCTIVIGAELAAPDWFAKGIGLQVATITEDLLNAAIEGSMLGCIALSRQARKDGNKKQAYTMTGLGWVFAGLTVITVGFRVFHASADAGEVLLWIRCAAGIVFCYLCHMNDDEGEAEEITPQQHRTQLEELTASFTQQVQTLKDEIGHEREQMKATVQQIIDQQENRLQRMVENVLSNVRITEVNQTGQNGLFLPAGGEQPAPAMSYSSELQRPNSSLSTADYEDIENKEEDTKAATGQRDEDTKDERTPASDPDRTEDKLNLALHYIREHLAHVDDEDFDTQLAPVLGLKRSASARFWKLKVIELLKASGEYPVKQANSQESEQSTYERLLAYAHANPQVTQKELASILNVSERTIRRNLAAMRKSGQLPANWTSDEDTKAATNQQSGQNTGHTATDEDINIEDRTHRFRVVR
jgi:hypothetical protein